MLHDPKLETGAAPRGCYPCFLHPTPPPPLQIKLPVSVVKIRQMRRIRQQVLATAATLLVAAGNLIPVDHVPPGVKVVSSAVLVLKIVSVLPDIVAHHRVQ